jgi:hypothetical protein
MSQNLVALGLRITKKEDQNCSCKYRQMIVIVIASNNGQRVARWMSATGERNTKKLTDNEILRQTINMKTSNSRNMHFVQTVKIHLSSTMFTCMERKWICKIYNHNLQDNKSNAHWFEKERSVGLLLRNIKSWAYSLSSKQRFKQMHSLRSDIHPCLEPIGFRSYWALWIGHFSWNLATAAFHFHFESI